MDWRECVHTVKKSIAGALFWLTVCVVFTWLILSSDETCELRCFSKKPAYGECPTACRVMSYVRSINGLEESLDRECWRDLCEGYCECSLRGKPEFPCGDSKVFKACPAEMDQSPHPIVQEIREFFRVYTNELRRKR